MFDWLQNKIGALIGYLELHGLWYPVKPYEEQVSENLWRGSRLNQKWYDDLARRGFTITVNLCAEDKYGDKCFQHGGYPNPIWIAVEDNGVPTLQQLSQFINLFTMGGFFPAPSRKVYVHCEAGKGRTGLFVACYRIQIQGWTPAAALIEAKAKGLCMPCQEQYILNFKGV